MPVPTSSSTARPAPMSETVYDWLLARIVDGTYPPGYLIDDKQLAQEAGTSTGPLREALGMLALNRVVDIVPRHYTVVSPINRTDLFDAAAVVYALTGQAMFETAGSLTMEDRARLYAYRDDILSAPETAREAVRTAAVWENYYGVFVRRHANPEFVRVLTWVGPYVRRFNHAYADKMDLAEEIRFERAEIDAALNADRRTLAAIWSEHVSVPLAALIGSVSDYAAVASTSPPSLADNATNRLRAAFLDGTLLPGDPLRETELMSWLGMSRTPVRTALSRMVGLGLAEQHAGQTARVASLDPRSIRETADTLWVLRAMVARFALRADHRMLAREIGRRLAEAEETTDPIRRKLAAVAAVRAIDDTIPPLSPLTEVMSALSLRCRWFISQNATFSAALGVHTVQRLMEAIGDGDAASTELVLADFMGVEPSRIPPR